MLALFQAQLEANRSVAEQSKPVVTPASNSETAPKPQPPMIPSVNTGDRKTGPLFSPEIKERIADSVAGLEVTLAIEASCLRILYPSIDLDQMKQESIEASEKSKFYGYMSDMQSAGFVNKPTNAKEAEDLINQFGVILWSKNKFQGDNSLLEAEGRNTRDCSSSTFENCAMLNAYGLETSSLSLDGHMAGKVMVEGKPLYFETTTQQGNRASKTIYYHSEEEFHKRYGYGEYEGKFNTESWWSGIYLNIIGGQIINEGNEGAKELIEKGLEKDPNNHHLLIEKLKLDLPYDEKIKLANKLEEQHPNWSMLHLKRGDVECHNKNFDAAEAEYNKCAELELKTAEQTNFLKAKVMILAVNYDRKTDATDQATKDRMDDKIIKEGQWLINNAPRDAPVMSFVYSQMFITYQEKYIATGDKNFEQMAKVFDGKYKALKYLLDPKNIVQQDYFLSCARAYSTLEVYQIAQNFYDEVARSSPSPPNALDAGDARCLKSAYYKAGKDEIANKIYEPTIKLYEERETLENFKVQFTKEGKGELKDSELYMLYRDYSYFLDQKGNAKQAEEYITKAMEIKTVVRPAQRDLSYRARLRLDMNDMPGFLQDTEEFMKMVNQAFDPRRDESSLSQMHDSILNKGLGGKILSAAFCHYYDQGQKKQALDFLRLHRNEPADKTQMADQIKYYESFLDDSEIVKRAGGEIFKSMIDLYGQQIKLDPKNADLYYQRSEAIGKYSSKVKLDPKTAKAMAALQTKDNIEAERLEKIQDAE